MAGETTTGRPGGRIIPMLGYLGLLPFVVALLGAWLRMAYYW